tara:strand:- start:1956 stop:2156 length:201 start_codon:yes stop_codon:yes gene_type:complete
MKTPQVTPEWNTGIYVGNGVVTSKPMQHDTTNYTDADLLACILSPHTTPDQKHTAKTERDKRAQQK